MEALLFLLLVVAPAVVAFTALVWAFYVFTRRGPLSPRRRWLGAGLLLTSLGIFGGYGVVIARLVRVSQAPAKGEQSAR
jgi:hypothetical protein